MSRGPSLSGGPFRLPGTGTSRHQPNCLCCIGPPDHSFERACAAVVALRVDGVGAAEAEKFVRLCCAGGGGDAVRLSKSKAKAAARSIRPKALNLPPIDADDIEGMQRAVLAVYRPTTTVAESPTASVAAASPASADARA